MKINLKKTVGVKDFAKVDWILPAREDGHGYNEILYRLFQKSGFTPKVVFQSPNASTNLRLVSEGLGVTIIGKSAMQGIDLNVKYVELHSIQAKVEMRFVWLKERKDELQEYINLFLKVFNEVQVK